MKKIVSLDRSLWHAEGWTAYETKYYNDLSFKLVN